MSERSINGYHAHIYYDPKKTSAYFCRLIAGFFWIVINVGVITVD